MRPWIESYGATIPAELPPLRYPSLAHLVRGACRQHAARTAFTCVVPNGMNGSLSFARVGIGPPACLSCRPQAIGGHFHHFT